MKLFTGDNNDNKPGKNSNMVFCPKCGSSSITMAKRGYSLAFGFLLANQMCYKCEHCGKMWAVKKNKK